MKIIVRAFWDEEAKVWVAVADGGLGLVTEAGGLEELSRKLPVLAEDLLEGEYSGPIDIELLTTSAMAAVDAGFDPRHLGSTILKIAENAQAFRHE